MFSFWIIFDEIFLGLAWFITFCVVNFVLLNKTMKKVIRNIYKLMWENPTAAAFA